MKKIVIVRAGSAYLGLRISYSAKDGSYDSWITLLTDVVFKNEETIVIDNESETEEGTSAIFFLAYNMLNNAKEMKADNPELKVFIITGSTAVSKHQEYKEDEDGIIWVRKVNFQGEKIREIVFS